MARTKAVAEDTIATPVDKATSPAAAKKSPKVVEKRTLTVDVLNAEGKKDGTISLPEAVFGVTPNKDLIAQAVRVYQMNQYQGTVLAKTRSQVSGTTKKMRKQKGTGSARHGAMTAPTFVGGGKAHGPQPREIRLSMPKKMRRMALFSALSQKAQTDGVVVVSGFEQLEPKTKFMARALGSIITNETKKSAKVLFITAGKSQSIMRSTKNLPRVSTEDVANLHTYEVLHANKVVFMKDAISKLEETFISKEAKS